MGYQCEILGCQVDQNRKNTMNDDQTNKLD